MICKNLLVTGLVGVISSFIASIIFWYLTFKRSPTKVEFPNHIAKEDNTEEFPGDFRYRVKLINSGHRDLNEIKIVVQLIIGNLRKPRFAPSISYKLKIIA